MTKILVINKWILFHFQLSFIVWSYICWVNPFLSLYYLTESSPAVKRFDLTGFSALGEVKSLEEESNETSGNWLWKIEWFVLLISYKRPNNLNGDLEVTYVNGKLDRKVALFSIHIHIYKSKRRISRLWFCQRRTIFVEKCVHLLAVPIEFSISEFTF